MRDVSECCFVLATIWAHFAQGGLTTSDAQDISDDCRSFNGVRYHYVPYSHNRTVELILVLNKTLPEVSVRMRSADCILECDDIPNSTNCTFSYQDAIEPALISTISKKMVKQQYVFHNISFNNFCASVYSPYCPKFFGPIITSTHQFENVTSRNVSVMRTGKKAESSTTTTVIAVSISVLVAVVIGATMYLVRGWRSRRATSAAPDVMTLLPEPTPPPPATAILLLYSRDSPRFERLMAAFRSLLVALTGLEVLDMLDERRMDEVARYPEGWLAHYLERPDVRVVLVASEGALARHRALKERRPLPGRGNFVDLYFTHALRIMQEDSDIGGNYNRVFTVRFEDVTHTRETFDLITSMRTFCLMRHIGILIHQINGGTDRPDMDDEMWSQSLLTGLPEADQWYSVLREHWA